MTTDLGVGCAASLLDLFVARRPPSVFFFISLLFRIGNPLGVFFFFFFLSREVGRMVLNRNPTNYFAEVREVQY